MARSICQSFQTAAQRLIELGLGYLGLGPAASTLSTGERQRMQLARAVRNRTTGVLYVLDEPSIGLHPSNIVGLTRVMDDLVADGNSVLLVTTTPKFSPTPSGSSRWGQRLAPGRHCHRPGNGGAFGKRSRLSDRAVSLWQGPGDGPAAGFKGPTLRQGQNPPLHGGYPHGKAPGGGHPPGQAYRGHRCVRLWKNHPDSGEPDPRGWRPLSTEPDCRSMSGRWRPPASSG